MVRRVRMSKDNRELLTAEFLPDPCFLIDPVGHDNAAGNISFGKTAGNFLFLQSVQFRAGTDGNRKATPFRGPKKSWNDIIGRHVRIFVVVDPDEDLPVTDKSSFAFQAFDQLLLFQAFQGCPESFTGNPPGQRKFNFLGKALAATVLPVQNGVPESFVKIFLFFCFSWHSYAPEFLYFKL